MKKINYQGGFSDDVFSTSQFQDYINSNGVFGYIGSSERNEKRDKIVENALYNVGLQKNGIALWLTSTDARHMMDDVEEDTSDLEFTQTVIEYTNNAYINVTIWSHPDHNGTLSCSIAMIENLKKYKY